MHCYHHLANWHRVCLGHHRGRVDLLERLDQLLAHWPDRVNYSSQPLKITRFKIVRRCDGDGAVVERDTTDATHV